MSGGIALLSFSERGGVLAARLGQALGGDALCAHGTEGFSLDTWTRAAFATADALVFVGAVGIAVRAIAPYVKSKAADPAVVVIDEGGRFVIPLLSGHLGGANDLARSIAALCGATAVITTATDINGKFAVDEWAKRQGCWVAEPERIKTVSAKVLHGERVAVCSPWEIGGTPPEGVVRTEAGGDIRLTLRRETDAALHLVPRIAVLGIGCRRGTTRETLETAFAALLGETGICEKAFCAAATIDLKADEQGLLDFCQAHRLPLRICTADELRQVPGEFTASEFVTGVTGVDNVCERSAVLAADGKLIERKHAGGGVTMAVAVCPYDADWRWQNG